VEKGLKIIANPAAGGGSGAKSIPRIEQILTARGLAYDLVSTGARGDAIELARQATIDGYAVVVAAGGDGTANEVINGLLKARGETSNPPPALGVLGIGRGCDFAHTIGVPHELEAACQVLAQGNRRSIDLGRVRGELYPDGRYFGNCVGVGFDAIATIEVSKLPRLGGFLSFFIAVLKTIFLYYRAPLTRIEFDDQTITQPSLMISILNGRRLGGGFWMAPEARPDDNLFDLCIAREMSRLQMIRMIGHFLRGTQASQEPISTGRGARITITAVEGSLPAQTDGEIICVDGERLEIELLPHAIEVIAPVPKEA
jgi:YegS/Rv2252/BmrU family lipid kinase